MPRVEPGHLVRVHSLTPGVPRTGPAGPGGPRLSWHARHEPGRAGRARVLIGGPAPGVPRTTARPPRPWVAAFRRDKPLVRRDKPLVRRGKPLVRRGKPGAAPIRRGKARVNPLTPPAPRPRLRGPWSGAKACGAGAGRAGVWPIVPGPGTRTTNSRPRRRTRPHSGRARPQARIGLLRGLPAVMGGVGLVHVVLAAGSPRLRGRGGPLLARVRRLPPLARVILLVRVLPPGARPRLAILRLGPGFVVRSIG